MPNCINYNGLFNTTDNKIQYGVLERKENKQNDSIDLFFENVNKKEQEIEEEDQNNNM